MDRPKAVDLGADVDVETTDWTILHGMATYRLR